MLKEMTNMAFETLTGIYRTKEANGTYRSAVCLSFIGEDVWVHGLTSTLPPSCFKELYNFIKDAGYSRAKYFRKKNNKVVLKIIEIKENIKGD